MDISKFKRFNEQKPLRVASAPFVCYVPDYTAEQELFRVDNEPINIIDNSKTNAVLQNVAQQQLVDVSSDIPFDTSGLSDKELVANMIPRQAEVSDLEDIAVSNLRDMDRFYKDNKNI